jgi:cyclophilin family peptidyl-prolyl cis-trans isomerase/HEAT repeat protein
MTRRLSVVAAALLCLPVTFACRERAADSRAKAGPTTAASGQAWSPATLLRAELQRDRNAVGEDDLGAESGQRRLAAVRALARIQDELSFEPLAKALADEDPAVVRWAAFGVGQLCRGREPEAVRRLVVRAASLGADPRDPARDDALGSLALALGRCASDEAEKTLRAWLRQPGLAVSAALGLGRIARERKRLDDASIAALLDAAAQNPDEGAFFFPIESLPSLGAAARERLLEVAGRALEQPGKARSFAARALAKGGPGAAPALRRLIEAADTSNVEGANAAAALTALGAAAQAELGKALAAHAQRYLDTDVFWSSDIGVLLILLDGLEPRTGDRTVLTRLAELPLEKDALEPVRRRKVMVRCRAAAALAGSASASAALLACDPAPAGQNREGALALLRVLARGSLAKARGARFQELARSPDRVVREAALELLVSHDEASDTPALLANALAANEVGVRATAAKVLARYPARASRPNADEPKQAAPLVVDAGVVQALSKQLAEVGVSNNIELSALLLDAAAALELLGAKPALERACASANATLRQHAERGFAALGEPKRRCPVVAGKEPLTAMLAGDFALELKTDTRDLRLTLSAAESPFATERIVQLARAGFYNGMRVHRVVPGFVVQIGDPDGDGFGGPDLPPLRDQLGLEPFDVGSVGIALAGRDTGLSQFFVTLRRAPHLDGDYSLVGHAEPGFGELVNGDLIREVTVRDLSVAK